MVFADELEKESAVQRACDNFPSGKRKLAEGRNVRYCGIATTILTSSAGTAIKGPSSSYSKVRCTLGDLLSVAGIILLMQKFDVVAYSLCNTFRIINKCLLVQISEDDYKKIGLKGTRGHNNKFFLNISLDGKSEISDRVLAALRRMPLTENVVSAGDVVIPKGVLTGWSQHSSKELIKTSVMCPFRPDIYSSLKRSRETGESQFDQFGEWLSITLLGGSPHPSDFPSLPKGAATLNITVTEGVFSSTVIKEHIARCSNSSSRWVFIDTQSSCFSPWKSAPISQPPLNLGIGVQYFISTDKGSEEGKQITQCVISSTGANIDSV